MRQWLFGLLAEAVWQQLDELAVRAARETALGASETGRLVAAWRALLRLHDPDQAGRCRRCGPSWARRLFGSRSPGGAEEPGRGELCTVWQVAIAYFVRRSVDR